MGISVDPRLADAIAANSGAVTVLLNSDADSALVVAALQQVRDAVFTVAHPEEPDDAFASFASDVSAIGGGASFWFDAADAEAYPEVIQQLVAAMTAAARSADMDGDLVAPQ